MVGIQPAPEAAPKRRTLRAPEPEPTIYDSGLVDGQDNPVFVNKDGIPVQPPKRKRTAVENEIHQKQLADDVQRERDIAAAEKTDKLVPEEAVMVSSPELPAPIPAKFVRKTRNGKSVVATQVGMVEVPNTTITSEAQASATKQPEPKVRPRKPKLIAADPATLSAPAPMAKLVPPTKPGKPVVTKVSDPTVGGWDVQIGPNKYNIFRDPENRWWYLDGPGHYIYRVLSTATKEDAINNLVTNEASWIARIEAERAGIVSRRNLIKELAQKRGIASKIVPTAPKAAAAPAVPAKAEVANRQAQINERIAYLDELKQTREITPEEHKARVAEARAELAATEKSPAPKPGKPKLLGEVANGWDVEIGPNRYRIFREEGTWYLDADGGFKAALSTTTKADALKKLAENEAKYAKKIADIKTRLEADNLKQASLRRRLEDWADKVIKAQAGKISANPFLDPEWVMANAVKGTILMERGATTFAKWSVEMLSQVGESIKPHLTNLWKYIHNEDIRGILNGTAEVDAVKPGAKLTPAQLIQQAVGDVAENKRLFLNMRQGTGVAKNPHTIFATRDGKTLSVGANLAEGGKSYASWFKETTDWMTPAQINQARIWYKEANKAFREAYGVEAPREFLLWLMAQQNASPSEGMGSVARVKDMIANLGTGKKGGLAHDKLMAVLTGELAQGAAAGLARKLIDFVDSGELRTTRTFHGNDPQMGGPAVADIWSGRDSGHVDGTTFNRLLKMAEEKNLFFNGEPVTLTVTDSKLVKNKDKITEVPTRVLYKTPSMRRAKPLVADLSSSPSGTQYDGISKWMNRGAEVANANKFNDADDWTPAEFQAVGWMRTLLQYGEVGQTVREAIELNTSLVPAEVNYSSGAVLPFQFPAFGDLSPAAQREITLDVMQRLVPDLVEAIGGSLRIVSMTEGQGRFGGSISPMMGIAVSGSAEARQILRDALGYVTDQAATMEWRPGLGGKGSRAIVIRRPGGKPFSDEELARLSDGADLGGFTLLRAPTGEDTLLLTDANKDFTPKAFTEKRAAELANRIFEWSNRAENADMRLDISNEPGRIISNANNWDASPNGQKYLENIVRTGGGTRLAKLVALRRGYAEKYLEPAFAKHSPELLAQFRAEGGDAKGVWLADSVARRDFHDSIAKVAADHPYGAAVTVKPPEAYTEPGTLLLLTPNKQAGVAVTPDGDLISVFKQYKSGTNIDPLLERAAQRAVKLDAYAANDGFLMEKYAQFGFRPVARVKFDRAYADSNWPYAKLGEPDVVLMVKDKDGVSGAPEIPSGKGGYKKVEAEVPVMSYDDAAVAQLKAVDAVRSFRSMSKARRGAINLQMLHQFGQTALGGGIGFVYGYNKDPDASLADRVSLGMQFAVFGMAFGNPFLRNAVLNGIVNAKIPVRRLGLNKYFEVSDNWIVFPQSVIGKVYDVIKGQAPLAESYKDGAMRALKELGLMRGKVATTDWHAAMDSLANRGDFDLILDEKLRVAAMKARQTVDDFAEQLIAAGLVEPGSDFEATMLRNQGKYLYRTYEVFTNPDFQYDPVLRDRAVAEYVKQQQLDKSPKTLDQLWQEGIELTLYQIAKAKGTTAMAPNARSFATGQGIARPDGSVLKPRKELSDAWRDMLGEITDPVRAGILTVDRLGNLLAAAKTRQKMADIGKQIGIFTPNATSTHTIPLTTPDGDPIYPGLDSMALSAYPGMTPKGADPLAKLWTTPEAAEGLRTMAAYQSHTAPYRWLATVTGNMKLAKTVFHPISYAPNFLSSLTQPLVQGHAVQMVMNPKIHRDAISVVFNTPFPSNVAKIERDIPVLIREGILRQGVNTQDMLETARASGATSLGNRIVTWLPPKAGKIVKGVAEGALATYGKLEEFPRVISFYAEVGRYAKVLFGKSMDNLTPQEEAVVYQRAIAVTKEVYPNSQNVPEVVKKFSTLGVLEPFVAFKYETFRTFYTTMRRAVTEFQEAQQTGNKRFITSATVRLTSLIGTAYALYALNEAMNETKGVSGEQDKALRRRLPEWDRTGLLIVTDFDKDQVAYANQSYLFPQSTPVAAIKAALEGKTPVDAASAFMAETAGSMVSDGGLFFKPLAELVSGYNEYGRKIFPSEGGKFVDVSGIESAQVRNNATVGQNFVIGAAHLMKNMSPGFMTEGMKWYKAAREEVGPDGQIYQIGDLANRLAGVRVQRIDLPLQFERQAGALFGRLNKVQTTFGEARNRKDATPASIEEAYQMFEQGRKIIFRDLVEYIRDGEVLLQPKDKILANLRESGISSEFLLGALNGVYIPGKKEKATSARDTFEALMALPEAKRDQTWAQLIATDPTTAKSLIPMMKEAAMGRTEEERMLLSVNSSDGSRARMIAMISLSQPDPTLQNLKYRELVSRGMARGETSQWLFGDPTKATRIWAEARSLTTKGQMPEYLPLPEPNSTPPTNPGASMRPPAVFVPINPPPPPPTPGQKTSFKEGRLYKDPTTGTIRMYRNGQFV